MDIEIGVLRADELDDRHRLGQQAFGHHRPREEEPALDPRLGLVARDRGRIVGALWTIPFGQWWGGRSVPMGGIAGVNIAPEARGRGIAQRLMRTAMDAMVEDGRPISALFPTTGTLYGSLGYGWAGEWAVTRVPLDALPTRHRSATVEVEPVDPVPSAGARQCYDAVAPAHPGWLDRGEVGWAFIEDRRRRGGRPRFGYEARIDGRVTGFAAYSAAPADGGGFVVDVEELVATDAESFRVLLGLLSDNGTMANHLDTRLPARTLLPYLHHAQRLQRRFDWWWMLRLVDLPGAVAQRGYPEGAVARIELEVFDAVRPSNTGRWILSVEGGQGQLERGGDGRVTVDVANLAALWSGAVDPATLAASGELQGVTDADVSALATAFAGPPPTVLDFF